MPLTTEQEQAKAEFYKKFIPKRRRDFIKHLNAAIEAMYDCHMDNNVAVLTLPIKELYTELTKT